MLECYLNNLGYSKKDINRFINAKELSKFSEEELCHRISNIFDYMLSFGYKKEEIISISIYNVRFFSWDVITINRKINNLRLIGYKKEEIIKMSVKYPNLFLLSEENIRLKKMFYDKIGISEIITKYPAYFNRSFDLIYARYVFYHRIGIKINNGNYSLLFVKQSVFINRFGKTNQQLVSMYNYNERIKKKEKTLRK